MAYVRWVVHDAAKVIRCCRVGHSKLSGYVKLHPPLWSDVIDDVYIDVVIPVWSLLFVPQAQNMA